MNILWRFCKLFIHLICSPRQNVSSVQPMKKRICVIGAGTGGLAAIKACREEGHDVFCYEKTGGIGGLWNYRPGEKNIGATVMGHTVVNTSKEMLAFSDFPPPADFPNFMHHSKVKEYLEMYTKKFGLLEYIHFCTEVSPLKGGAQWEVILSTDKGERSELFDAVMVANGHHAKPKTPHFPGIEKFVGPKLHTREYRDSRDFARKNVLCVGICNSGLDVATDLAGKAKNVVLSTRRGGWITPRVWKRGRPYDVVLQSRFYHWLMRLLPWSLINDVLEYQIQQRMDHKVYGLKPKHRFFQQAPFGNDSFITKLAYGQITITDEIQEIREKSVVTKSGRELPADAIIFATGYKYDFPFFTEQQWIDELVKDNGEVELYNYVFPLEIPGLAFIGLFQPLGSFGPAMEMQSRWAAGVFSCRIRLPSVDEMRKNIVQKRLRNKKRFYESEKHNVQINLIPYMDELATYLGCRPNLIKIALEDPWFALRLFVGPNVSYVYRLYGPGSSPKEAKNAICTVSDRIRAPLKPGASIEVENGCESLRRLGWFMAALWCFTGLLFIGFGWFLGGGFWHVLIFLLFSFVASLILSGFYLFFEDISWV